MKEAPKPPRTFLEFIFDRTNALRQSHAESLFQRQFNAARVQPPDTCMTGATGNVGGKPPPGAGDAPSQRRPGSAAGHLHDRGNQQRRGQALAGCLLLRFSQCRKRSNAGVPGAVAPGKIILESPPSPPGKSALRARVGGISFPFGEGGRIKTKGRAGIQKGKPPLRTPQRQVKPIPQKTKGNTENSTQSTVDNTPGFML